MSRFMPRILVACLGKGLPRRRGLLQNPSIVEIELTPEQPAEVAAAIDELVAAPAVTPDPWWQAGLEEALET
jgi:hypothetical protein